MKEYTAGVSDTSGFSADLGAASRHREKAALSRRKPVSAQTFSRRSYETNRFDNMLCL
jgi:hypothetical protein